MTLRYLIATNPRSGSSFLCDLLHKSGAAGMRPRYEDTGWEYLGTNANPEEIGGRSSLEFLEDAFLRSELGGAQGFKVMWPDIVCLFARCADAEERQVLRTQLAALPWIRLRRRDRVAQAVSWAKAVQTQQWSSLRSSQPIDIQYNYFLIARRFADARGNERAWDRWFDEMGIEPLELIYEEFVLDLPGTVETIARHLGREDTMICRADATNYEVQRNAVNQEWSERFLRDRATRASRGMALVRSMVARSTWRELVRRLRESLRLSAPRSKSFGAPRT